MSKTRHFQSKKDIKNLFAEFKKDNLHFEIIIILLYFIWGLFIYSNSRVYKSERTPKFFHNPTFQREPQYHPNPTLIPEGYPTGFVRIKNGNFGPKSIFLAKNHQLFLAPHSCERGTNKEFLNQAEHFDKKIIFRNFFHLKWKFTKNCHIKMQ